MAKKILDKIAKILILVIATSSLFSCSDSIKTHNQEFLKKYGDDVARINRERDAMFFPEIAQAKKEDDEYNKWRDPGYVLGVEGTIGLETAFVDTYNLKLPDPPQEYLPDMQTLLEGKTSNRVIPDQVFMVSYTAQNYPASYKTPGVNFDDIRIPLRDAFGVETALGEKDYTRVGQIGLQKNIDYLNANFTKEDKEILSTLVKEQKDIIYKKRWGIVEKKKDKKDEKEDKKKDEENKQEVSKNEDKSLGDKG